MAKKRRKKSRNVSKSGEKPGEAKHKSRKQRYRAQQRNSWLTFLGKLALFFVPVVLATIWLIWMLVGFGTELPVLVLDLGKNGASTPSEPTRNRVWSCESYGKAAIDGGIKLPEKIAYGGPQKNSLVIFNDLLGSARMVDGQLQPHVFVPATAAEHQTHVFYGLLNQETEQHDKQWQPFKNYLKGILDQLSAISSSKANGKKHVLLAFDIDHPDLPGRLPPQANRFVSLFQDNWEVVRAELKDSYPNFDVFIWLSHSPGQMSYWDSNPDLTESFFKHRFERGLTGDVYVEIPRAERSSRDVKYSHLKKYLQVRVASDADLHNLAQNPVFLEPENIQDFPLLRFATGSQAGVADPGKLFGYRKREKHPDLDARWAKFDSVRHEFDWNVENPMAVQQTTMLLQQMERLWYQGKTYSDAFARLDARVGDLLENHQTIKPVQHSIADAVAEAQRLDSAMTLPTEFSAKWLRPIPDYNSMPEGPDRDAAEDESDAQKKDIRKWQAKYPDWRGAYLAWQAIVAPEGGVLDREMIESALQLLTPDQKVANRPRPGVTCVDFDELVFLKRLTEELVWPDKIAEGSAHTNFEKLVREAISTRNTANRFAANLTPILTDQFQRKFEGLEAQRRLYEDRLFANDNLFGTDSNRLSLDYPKLDRSMSALLAEHQEFQNRFVATQRALVNGANEFRYRIQSLASAKGLATDFGWIREFSDAHATLGQTKINAFLNPETTNRLSEFGSIGRDVFNSISGGRASTPSQDLASFADANLNLGVADGNLLGRRLLLWPELTLADRKRLHDGLSSKFVTLDEDEKVESAQPSDTSPPTDAEGLPRELVDLLHKLPLMQETKDAPAVPGNREEFFLLAAAQSSRLTPFSNLSDTDQKLGELTNRFHARRSNLDFRRTSYDLCGTATNGTCFAQSSLKMHQQLIEGRLSDFKSQKSSPELNSSREKIVAAWQDEYDQLATPTWRERIQQVDQFCNNFGQWKWNRRKQYSINRSLANPMNNEIDQQNKMLFSLAAVGAKFNEFGGASPDQSTQGEVVLATPNLARAGGKLRVYLRGHKYLLETEAPRKIEEDRLKVELTNRKVHGSKIQVRRAADAPIIGHVKILIDCSFSMGGGNNSLMVRAKKYVNAFLDSAARRSDLKVSLYALGATVRHTKTGKPINEGKPSLQYWKQSKLGHDVWEYQGNKNRLDSSTLAGFSSAVKELKAFGETPILAALDIAIDKTPGKPQLLVLLTDGCEYSKKTGKKNPVPFDDPNVKATVAKIRNNLDRRSTDLAIFNMSSVEVNGPLNRLAPDAQKRLEGQFEKSISTNFNLAEIVRRIYTINKLAGHQEFGEINLNRMEKFFTNVLPRPVVDRRPAFLTSQNPRRQPEDSGFIKVVQLGPDDRPPSWQLGMKFRTNSPITLFNRDDRQWSTNRQTYGNELLDFVYNPVLDTFKLSTDWEESDGKKSFLVGSESLLIRSDPPRNDKPSFLVASSDSQLLTPVPSLTWVELSQKDRPNSVLIQDFNLEPQTRSNVHRIQFPEVEEVWRNKNFFDRSKPIDLEINWLDRFPADFWTKLDLSQVDSTPPTIRNENGETVELANKTFVSMNSLFQMSSAPFKGFDFQLQYVNLNDGNIQLTAKISFEKSSKNPRRNLDRWLVQILAEDGTVLHRSCRSKAKREYVLQSQESGGKRLVHIEHELSINRKDLKRTGGRLGFANLDEVLDSTAKISNVKFPNYE